MAKDVDFTITGRSDLPKTINEADLLEQAWNLIANAFPFDANRHTPGWHEAAARWRDQYHDWLDRHLHPRESIETVVNIFANMGDWSDITGTDVQIRVQMDDTPGTFRIRPKPRVTE